MKLFNCNHCGQRLYFENVFCTNCDAKLGFLPEQLQLVSLKEGTFTETWRPIGEENDYRFCTNAVEYAACNWMIPINDDHTHCIACRLNKTIPDLAVEGNVELWRALELEKRRFVFALLRLGLPIIPDDNTQAPLTFAFLADNNNPGDDNGKVVTGHTAGLITINLEEADPVARERMRDQMAEPYRTLLGHFRHESGHYYWDCLIRDTAWHEEFRSLFGDERADYSSALEHHYRAGAPQNWQESFISSYASMHPWEDWAETWAHYLHMVDTIETAWQFNISLRPTTGLDFKESIQYDLDPYRSDTFDTLLAHWIPLTFALNSLNRSMGHQHAYPFVIAPKVVQKLDFVHRVVS